MPAVSSKQNRNAEKYMVPVLLSAFRTLKELSKAGPLPLNELTRRTNISKSTVFRILTTLHHLGYVIRDGQRNYHVSQNLASLVSGESNSDLLRQAALPCMLQLRDGYGETVNLGRLQLDKVVYIEVVPSEFALRLSEWPGAQVAVHASALGKAILAFSPAGFAEGILRSRELPILTSKTIVDPEKLMAELRHVKARGYAFDRGETSMFATCVAAPILDAYGKSIAAMSISGPTSRFNPRRESPVLASLMKAAGQISRQLRERPAALDRSLSGKPAEATATARKATTDERKRASLAK